MHILIHEGMVIHKQASYKTALRAFLENWLIMRVAGKDARKYLNSLSEQELGLYYNAIDLEFENLLHNLETVPSDQNRQKVIEYFISLSKKVKT